MNFLIKAFQSIAISPVQSVTKTLLANQLNLINEVRFRSSLQRLHRKNVLQEQGLLKKKKKKRSSPLGGNPFLKGIILKTVIKKPRKPNSANRKCVLVKLSNGKETFAYVPGIGHNLQEHQIVLCRGGRLKDVPGVKIRCVRGKYDLPHVVKPNQLN